MSAAAQPTHELSRITPGTLHSRSYVVWFDKEGNCTTLDTNETHAFIYDPTASVPPSCLYYIILSEDPTLEDYRLLKSRFSCPSELDRCFHTFNNSISHARWKAGQLSEIGSSSRIDFYVQYKNPTRLSVFIGRLKRSSIDWLSSLKGYFLASSFPLVEVFEKNEEKQAKDLAEGEDPAAGGRMQLWTMRNLVLFPYLDRVQLSNRLWKKDVGNMNDSANLWYSKHSISLCRVSDGEAGDIAADLYLFDQFCDWTLDPVAIENNKLRRLMDGDVEVKDLSFKNLFTGLVTSRASATRICWYQGGAVNLMDHQIAKRIRMACLLDLLRIIAAQLARYIDDLNFQATKADLPPHDKYHGRNNSHLLQLEAVLLNLSYYATYLKKKLRLPREVVPGPGSSVSTTNRYQKESVWLHRMLSNLESDIDCMRRTVVSIRAHQENSYRSRSDTRQRQESLHIRKLAILATIFLPLSLATGLLSMQTRVSELGNLLYDYVGVVVTLAWVLMFYFSVDINKMRGTALMFFPYPRAVVFVALCVAAMSFQFGMWWEVKRGWMSLGLGLAPVGLMAILIWVITKFMH
ncbi:hypothetical protein TWF281_009786 [Arthrobotrys megalospora]